MVTKFRAFMVCATLVLGAALALAADGIVEVRVHDWQGTLVTDGELAVHDADGNLIGKYLPRADGVFEVGAQVGDKLELSVGGLTLRDKVKFSEIVPASEQIIVSLARAMVSNDECADAIPVAVPSVTSGSTVGATFDNAGDCDTSNTAPGVWYSVVGTGGEMTASTCPDNGGDANYDTKISVYCADCEDKTCIGGNDDSCSASFLRSTVTWCSEAGVTYNILVHGFSSATGDFDLSVDSAGGTCQVDPDRACSAGACCTCLNEPFNCSIQSQSACLAMGGIPRGAGTVCNPSLGAPIVYQETPNIPILDNTTISHTITVQDVFTIGDVNVDLGISHTWVGDLDVIVEHNGVSLSIWDRRCSSSDNIMATADDEGEETLCSVVGAGPIDSVFYPPEVAGLGPLSVFDGMNAAGDWTISITDNVGGDTGTLNQWSLHIDGVGTPVCEQNVVMCHGTTNPETIVVGESSVPHHIAHGDTVGACSGDPEQSGGSFGRN